MKDFNKNLFALTFLSLVSLNLAATEMFSRRSESPGAIIRGVSALPDNQVLVNTSKGFFQFSAEKGTWTNLDILPQEDIATFLKTSKGDWLVAPAAGGIKKSSDQGKTWNDILGESWDNIHIKFISEDSTGALLAASSEESAEPNVPSISELYLSRAGEAFQKIHTLPFTPKEIVFKEGGKQILAAVDSAILSSTDLGKTFTPIDLYTLRKNDYSTERILTFGPEEKLWVLGRDLMICDWNLGNQRSPYSIPAITKNKSFVRNQRGEIFVFENGSFRGGKSEFNLLDVSGASLKKWECNMDTGCAADFQSVQSVISNQDHSQNWLVTDNGIFQIGEKKIHQVKIQIKGKGVVSVFNENRGTLVPVQDNQVHTMEQFGGSYDKIYLNAEAKRGKHFLGWSQVTCADPKNESCSLELSANLDIVATFEE